MTYPKIILKTGNDRRLLQGHLWIFSNEIQSAGKNAVPGSIVDIFSCRNHFLGRGFFNPYSLISARILTDQEESIDGNFFSRRIGQAYGYRKLLYPGSNSYRLVFGESDLLPGLVIDRFENVFVIQSYCLGMDLLMPVILEGLKSHFKPETIVKKNDSATRALEKIPEETGLIEGQLDGPVKISQKVGGASVEFLADPLNGQKTGFFFDQRENRERLFDYAGGKTVLDCFSYTGGFGIYAAKGGAKEVVSVESSKSACDLLEKNFKLNDLRPSVICGDVQETLERFQKEKCKFDIIVLDPPALAKSRKHLFGALRKYKKLNDAAMSLINRDGILVSCSCSHHVGRQDFLSLIGEAGYAQKRKVQVMEMRGPSRDHPLLPSMPETDYLKCAIVRVR